MFGILSAVLFICFGVWGIIVLLKIFVSPSEHASCSTMRCPSCGAPVRIYGNTWECTECRDFGRYGH